MLHKLIHSYTFKHEGSVVYFTMSTKLFPAILKKDPLEYMSVLPESNNLHWGKNGNGFNPKLGVLEALRVSGITEKDSPEDIKAFNDISAGWEGVVTTMHGIIIYVSYEKHRAKKTGHSYDDRFFESGGCAKISWTGSPKCSVKGSYHELTKQGCLHPIHLVLKEKKEAPWQYISLLDVETIEWEECKYGSRYVNVPRIVFGLRGVGGSSMYKYPLPFVPLAIEKYGPVRAMHATERAVGVRRKKRTREFKEKRWEEQGKKCICPKCKWPQQDLSIDDTEMDHKQALVNNGADEDDNIQLLCRICHGRKTRVDLLIFRMHGKKRKC